VEQVNLSTTEGDIGVLAGHVPSILQLKPGLIDIFEGPASSPNTVKTSFFGIY
jgi:F-type H+-transporting ATPase subunit delta